MADRAELETFVPSAKEINRYYDPPLSLHEDLRAGLESLWMEVIYSLYFYHFAKIVHYLHLFV